MDNNYNQNNFNNNISNNNDMNNQFNTTNMNNNMANNSNNLNSDNLNNNDVNNNYINNGFNTNNMTNNNMINNNMINNPSNLNSDNTGNMQTSVNNDVVKQKTNKNAILSIVFSIVSMFIFWWLSLVGISTGVVALREIKAKNEKGKVLAIIGIIIGAIGEILYWYSEIIAK